MMRINTETEMAIMIYMIDPEISENNNLVYQFLKVNFSIAKANFST